MKKKTTNATINVRGTEITVIRREDEDYISLTDMLKAKDGDFFISDWLRNLDLILRETYIDPALAQGLVERRIPEKPTSRLQKYRLTQKGRSLLAQFNMEGGRS